MADNPTNVAFLAAIQAMSVTSVAKHYDFPPLSLSAGDLPAAFPLMPVSGQGEPLATCLDLSKTRSIGYVICVEALGLDIQELNYGKMAALMDKLETALDALAIANFIEYDIITTTEFGVGKNNFWSIVADIRTRNA